MTPESGDNKNDVLLDLNFVPTWARKPPEASPYGEFIRDESGSSRSNRRHDAPRESRDRERFDRRRREGGGRERSERDTSLPRPPPRPEQPEGAGAPERGPSTEWGDRGGMAQRGARPEALPPPFPVDVAFVPERAGLITIARRIAKVRRAFSLFEVGALFLSQPEYFTFKLTMADAPPPPPPPPTPDTPPAPGAESAAPPPAQPAAAPERKTLFQCRECKQVFTERGLAVAHAMAKHMEAFYRREEQTVEPPQGVFTCVARCGLSGELLGPPNYHSFNDRVLELHRTRFSHLSLDDYRRRIENVHDAALIEQWKEQMKKRTVYHVVSAPPDQPPLQSFTEVEKHFTDSLSGEVIKEGTTFTMPGPISRELDDRRLRRAVMDAWHRENRFPLRLSITLRLAFRHLGLHTFKTAAGGNFVTAIVPAALDPETAIPLIKEIIQVLDTNPGTERGKLLEILRPGTEPDSAPVHEVLSQLRWLVDKGHVIEFSDGRLAVPRSAVRKVQQAKREERKHGRPPGRPEAE